MANHKDAVKRNKQNEQQRLRNRGYRTKMRNQLKAFREAVASGDKANAAEAMRVTTSVVQHLATKGVIHKRQAARRVARLAHAVKTMA